MKLSYCGLIYLSIILIPLALFLLVGLAEKWDDINTWFRKAFTWPVVRFGAKLTPVAAGLLLFVFVVKNTTLVSCGGDEPANVAVMLICK